MDAGLNKNVGIAIRSFYKPILKPDASEKHLLVAGKICTLIFGGIIILLAIYINSIRTTNLFDFVNQLAANLLIPLALPLIYGLFYKKTPGWSAWSTGLIAGGASWLIGKYLTPEMFQQWMGWTTPLNGDEKTYLKLAVTTIGGTMIIGSAWYFFTSLFYKAAPQPERERIETFFTNLSTPVDKHGVEGVQTVIYKLLGTLCMVYGGFILLLMAIPNKGTGRLAFLFCGGVMFAVGFVLSKAGKRKEKLAAAVSTVSSTVNS
jgi:Na+/proline symporter